MDDYNFSFSDNWSVENDVRSGESISHNSRDYEPEFTTDQIFESREDMLAWVQSVGLKYGIVAASCRSAFLVVKEEESTNRHGIRLKGNACKETLGLKNAIAHFNCEVYQNIHTVSGGV
ncbi:hypothetical protein RHMOL_Rhmol02G0229700 [Rhododendron molle]|uniref:Uncharacterized protein n=1 Tax=Rhododendron molle TaxID=49168 RepID=A0ACC0PUZ6_RHOML|nr:hypothetical protein RHMOL_Rhmol02G0229700 [Rhododendron molle]